MTVSLKIPAFLLEYIFYCYICRSNPFNSASRAYNSARKVSSSSLCFFCVWENDYSFWCLSLDISFKSYSILPYYASNLSFHFLPNVYHCSRLRLFYSFMIYVEVLLNSALRLFKSSSDILRVLLDCSNKAECLNFSFSIDFFKGSIIIDVWLTFD